MYLSQGTDHSDCIPYKLIDYLTIGKPILAVTSVNSATYNIMQELNSGIAADMKDPNSIYSALKELLINEKEFSYKGVDKYSLNNFGEEYYKLINRNKING